MPSDRRPLRDLGVALLNATLLLLAAALILALTLTVQLRGLVSDVQTGVQAQIASLQPQVEAARREASATLAALESARNALPPNPGAIALTPTLAAAPNPALVELRALIERLERLVPPAPTADALPTDLTLRQIGLALLRGAAQGLISAAP